MEFSNPQEGYNMRTAIKIVAVCLVILVIVWFPRATRFRGHTKMVAWAVVSPDANYVVSGSIDDGTARIWEVATRKQLAVFEKSGKQTFVFSSDSKMVATGDKDNAVIIWNVADGKELLRLRGHTSMVLSLAFSPDGKALASWDEDKTVKVWDLVTTKELFTLQHSLNYITSVAYSPDGKLLACGGRVDFGSQIQLRDAITGKELRSLNKPEWRVSELLFSPDSATLCGVDDTTLALWDVASGKERECECPKWLDNDDDYIRCLAFSPDSRTLAVGHSEAIGLWDVASGKNTITFTEDGKRPYLGFSDRFFLDPEERRPPTLAAATFKPNGDLMVLGLRYETVAMWRLTTVKLAK